MRCSPSWLVFVLCACNTGGGPGVVTLPEAPSSAPPKASAATPKPTSNAAIPTAYFPPGTFPQAVDSFVAAWYGKHLTAMHEPSLWAAAVRGQTAYRFLWLRTWGRPIAVRATLDGGRAHLFATRLSGDGGYDPGTVDAQRDRDLSPAEWQRIEDAIAAAGFDAIDTEADSGFDGAQWVIERAKGGSYRLVERWSAKEKYPDFARACDVLLDLAGRDLVTGSVY